MIHVAHRINTIKELNSVPVEYGVEIDLRDQNGRVILSHEPFCGGEEFEKYLKHYKHKHLILNIKSERIEEKVLEHIKERGIKDYFFLDSSFPMIYLLSSKNEKNIALRFSEFERIDTILAMRGKARWVWVDCFTKLPINKKNYAALKNAGFKLCLVSPELQNRPEDINNYCNYLQKERILFDAVCTKTANIAKWK